MARLHKGESARSDGRFMYRYRHNDKTVSVYARTLKELREKEKQIAADLANGIKPIDGMTLNQAFDKDMSIKEIKQNTRQNYNHMYDLHVRESELGKTPVKSIVFSDVESFYIGLHKSGMKRSSIKLLHTMIYSALSRCVKDRIIGTNPAAEGAFDNIKEDKNKKETITQETIVNLLNFCRQSADYRKHTDFLVIALESAMRHGELTGLTWDCVDIANKTVTIEKQLLYKDFGDGWKFHIQKPKTAAGERQIAMTNAMVKSFSNLRKYYMANGITSQNIDGYANFVFLNRNGSPYAANMTNAFLRNLERTYNKWEIENATKQSREPLLVPHLSCHILRHTSITLRSEQGMSIKSLQSLAGHADATITANVYDHSNNLANQRKELERVGSICG